MEKCSAIIKTDNRQCSRYAVENGVCKQHSVTPNVKLGESPKILVLNIIGGEYKECTCRRHHTMGSKYPKESVPKFLFKKDVSDKYFKYCLDCRLYNRKNENNARSRHKYFAHIQEWKNSNVGYCTSKSHDTLECSTYKRDQVPIELFRKYPMNPMSKLYETCLDCRTHIANYKRDYIKGKKLEAENIGKFFCTNCHYIKDLDEVGINLDGSHSILCVSCKQLERVRSINIRQWYNEIKIEFIIKFNVSCQKCEYIFLKPLQDDHNIIRLETYCRDNVRYTRYNELEYPVVKFLLIFKECLELRIIQLDHLPEEELRSRGLLLPTQSYIPKIRNVSKMSGKDEIYLESKKCQHLCGKCHLEETIHRETGIAYNSRSRLQREKLEYVNDIKEKNKGCSICKFWDPRIVRFFEMDHLDPQNKINSISRMIKDNSYSLDDIIAECNKCRVLCQYCHIIHTDKQRKLFSD